MKHSADARPDDAHRALLSVDSLEDAYAKLAACRAGRPPATENVTLAEALSRVLARDITSDEDIPAFARSTVDGYAVVASDTSGAGESIPAFLDLAGAVRIGSAAPFTMNSGQCAYVPTGGMIPQGADAMVMIEYAEHFSAGLSGGKVAIYRPSAPGEGIVLPGEDAKAGTPLLRRGAVIGPAETGALASAGVTAVSVYKALTLAVISTGDELVSPEKKPAPGEIRDINTYALSALAVKSGFVVVSKSVLPDDEAAIEAAVREAIRQAEIVVVSGGSSKGEKDYTAEVIGRAASPGIISHGIALKPGKPTVIGFDEPSGVIILGLPGHPVSALVVFDLLLARLYRELTGQREAPPFPARMARNAAGSPGKTTVLPVRLLPGGDGFLAEPLFGKSSLMRTLTAADGYVLIGRNKEGLKEGEAVQVIL